MDFRQMPQGLFEKLITWFFLWGERKAARLCPLNPFRLR